MSEKIMRFLICQALFVAFFTGCEKSGSPVDNDELSTVPIEFSLTDFSAEVSFLPVCHFLGMAKFRKEAGGFR